MYKINYNYLRPKKADALRKWYDSPFEKRRTLSVWTGTNATILPLRKIDGDQILFGRGGVVDSNGSYVASSAIEYRIEKSYPYDYSLYRDEKVVFCGYLINHWGHFLVESVCRLWYVLENDTTVDKYVFILEENSSRTISGNYKEFLSLLNIWDKVEFVTVPTTYREVIVPELSFLIRNYYSPKYVDIFNTVAKNITVNPQWACPKKIYFSRSLLPQNKHFEFGFEALDNFFDKNGYTILYPEKIPLQEFIHYIRNAKTIATVSGSLPHNMMFANDGQTLQLIERCVVNNDYQVHINTMRQLNATYIDANIPLYTVSMAGPFILGYNSNLERFATDHGYFPPDKKYSTSAYYKSLFVKYVKTYTDMYQYQWFMDGDWPVFSDYLYEAYLDGFAFFKDYITRKKPFLWHHYFEFHYWKQFIKRILRWDA